MPVMSAPLHRLPEYYQQADVEQLIHWLEAGECCALVEPGSVRLHPLLRFMSRADILERYLTTAQAGPWVMVRLSPFHLLSPQGHTPDNAVSAWPGYELMLDRLRRQVGALLREGVLQDPRPQSDGLLALAERCRAWIYDSQTLGTDAGLRPLEELIAAVLDLSQTTRLVFLFDQLEGFAGVPPNFWQSLYGLRDSYAGRLMFVTGSSQSPAGWMHSQYPSQDLPQDFLGLFAGFTRSICRLDGPSTRAVIENLEKRYQNALSGDLVRHLSYTVGRHPVLLEHGYHIVADLGEAPELNDEALLDLLLDHDSIRLECQLIYDSLPQPEQAVLREIVSQARVDTGSLAWQELLAKHLVTLTDEQRPVLTIPVLAMYMRDHLAQA